MPHSRHHAENSTLKVFFICMQANCMRVKAGEVKKVSHKYSTLEQQIVEVRRMWLSCRMPQSLRKQPVNASASLGIPCGHLMAWTCYTFDLFFRQPHILPACLGAGLLPVGA